jgi:type II restriction/modification system DNA methylase subunit YeeA
MTPQQFVHTWKHSQLKEKSGSQSHFIDLCRLVGHPAPHEADPSGESFTFEAFAAKQTGYQGYADVWKKGFFAWEYKGKHANLDAAYQQLLQYRESLYNPPLLVVSDMARIVIHTNFTNTVKQTYELALDDLLDAEKREILRAVFFDPERLRAKQTTAHVTAAAATQFARIAEHFRDFYKEEPEVTAHYLIRLFFCLFAEDIGLLPNGLFTRLLSHVTTHTALENQLRRLFREMAGGGYFGADAIPHVDGGLFDDDFVLGMDGFVVDVLLDVARLDWSSIEPSILGTLFERSLDPAKRAQLGAHYTSREDILLIVEPVLMAPLRQRWEDVRDSAEQLAQTGVREAVQAVLEAFSDELAAVRVLDPACGSGNFLYVTLRELLDLEKKAILMAQDLGTGGYRPRVSPAQLHGIEINPYAHQLAQATVWIGYIQWLHENGFGLPAEPILKPLDNIHQMDAILAYDDAGNPVEPDWPEAEVIIGNPPFLGDKRMRRELGRGYVEALRSLYGNRLPGQSDLVCYWFERARKEITQGRASRAGLLATSSIRHGSNRVVLDRIKESGDIFMAWSDQPWTVEGAAVRVSLVGFDTGDEQSHVLDGDQVDTINPDLTAISDVTAAKVLEENEGIAFIGSQKGGPFEIPARLAQRWMSSAGNPSGRPNSDVVRPWANGTDIARRPREMWIIDFGTSMTLEQASEYEAPFEYVKESVFPRRINLSRKNHRVYWWLHAESRPGMRQALSNIDRYIATPRVAKHRLFVWLSTRVLADSRLVVIAREDEYFFGVLHSRLHEQWTLATSSWHGVGNDPTYNARSCFETFPFPWPPGAEPQDDPRVQAIAAAARELNEKREAWLNPPGLAEKELKQRTLTNLYNQMPTWLRLLHERLDRAVLDAYGWPHDLSDEAILERLLALNLERASEL